MTSLERRDDIFNVKNNYLWKLSGLTLISAALASSALAASSKSTLSTLGDDTFAIVRQANSGLVRDTAALKAEALDDAAKYCAAQGKQLKVISATELKPLFVTADYARAKVVFKALNAGDAELKNEPAAPVHAEFSEKPAGQGDMYNELLKLDDLRKKGILTDEEFQSEKKKILKRSK